MCVFFSFSERRQSTRFHIFFFFLRRWLVYCFNAILFWSLLPARSGLGFTQPSELLTLTSSLRQSSRPYSRRGNKFTTVLFHAQADLPVRGMTSASKLLIVMTECPWIYPRNRIELPARTCIRLTPHTYRPHVHGISSHKYKTLSLFLIVLVR